MKRFVGLLFLLGCAQGGGGGGDASLPDGTFPDTFASPDVPRDIVVRDAGTSDVPGFDTSPGDSSLGDVGSDVAAADAGPSCIPTMSGTWQEVGAPTLASGAHADTAIAPDGTLGRIRLAGAPPSPRVETFDGTTWRDIGNFPPGGTNVNVVRLAHDGVSFVAMVVRTEGGVELPVAYRLEGGNWTEIFRVGTGAPPGTNFNGSASLFAADGVVRVAGVMQTTDFASRRVVVAEQRSGAVLDLMSPAAIGMFGSFAPSVADVDGDPLLTWGVVGPLQLARFDGTWMNWSTTGLFMGFASNTKVASRGDVAWVVGTDFVDINTNIVRLFRVNGTNLIPVEGPFDRDATTNPAFVADIAVDVRGRAVVAMTEPFLAGGTTQHIHVLRASMDGAVALGMPIDEVPGDTSGTASITTDACGWPVMSIVEARMPAGTNFDVRTYRFED